MIVWNDKYKVDTLQGDENLESEELFPEEETIDRLNKAYNNFRYNVIKDKTVPFYLFVIDQLIKIDKRINYGQYAQRVMTENNDYNLIIRYSEKCGATRCVQNPVYLKYVLAGIQKTRSEYSYFYYTYARGGAKSVVKIKSSHVLVNQEYSKNYIVKKKLIKNKIDWVYFLLDTFFTTYKTRCDPNQMVCERYNNESIDGFFIEPKKHEYKGLADFLLQDSNIVDYVELSDFGNVIKDIELGYIKNKYKWSLTLPEKRQVSIMITLLDKAKLTAHEREVPLTDEEEAKIKAEEEAKIKAEEERIETERLEELARIKAEDKAKRQAVIDEEKVVLNKQLELERLRQELLASQTNIENSELTEQEKTSLISDINRQSEEIRYAQLEFQQAQEDLDKIKMQPVATRDIITADIIEKKPASKIKTFGAVGAALVIGALAYFKLVKK